MTKDHPHDAIQLAVFRVAPKKRLGNTNLSNLTSPFCTSTPAATSSLAQSVPSGRLSLGYHPLWEVSGIGDVPYFSLCKFCDFPYANHLHHDCFECPSVREPLFQVQSLTDVCKYLRTDNLDNILMQNPHFGGC